MGVQEDCSLNEALTPLTCFLPPRRYCLLSDFKKGFLVLIQLIQAFNM